MNDRSPSESLPRREPSNHEARSAPEGSLADHLVTFGRLLRRAGLRIGTDQIMHALRAVELVGVRRKEDFYQALFTAFVRDRSGIPLFDRAFRLFWRAPSETSELVDEFMKDSKLPSADDRRRRGMENRPRTSPAGSPTFDEGDSGSDVVAAAYSPVERLKKKDFAEMTADETEEAKAFIRRLPWPFEPRPVRRLSRFEAGRRFDLHATIRRGLRNHGEILRLSYAGRKRREQPVVLLCDISGSMELYSRMLLRFMHSVTTHGRWVESFVFGTRLTRITRQLARRDVDAALAAVAGRVDDWDGGTRIGESIRAFNYDWLRRVLRSGGIVIVISDGCDRGNPDLLEREMARLARSCRILIWLNPLLRYRDYEPLTRGMRAALPYVDRLAPVHSLESLEQLGSVLASLPSDRRRLLRSA